MRQADPGSHGTDRPVGRVFGCCVQRAFDELRDLRIRHRAEPAGAIFVDQAFDAIFDKLLPQAIEKTDMDPMLVGHFTNGKAALKRGFYNPGAKSGRIGPAAFPHNLNCCMVSPGSRCDIRCDCRVFILDKIAPAQKKISGPISLQGGFYRMLTPTVCSCPRDVQQLPCSASLRRRAEPFGSDPTTTAATCDAGPACRPAIVPLPSVR